MQKHIYGQIWGILQLGFWLIMIPWILIAIPGDLWVDMVIKMNPERVPEGVQEFFQSQWVDWRTGLVILGIFYMLLVSIALIWVGWHKLHPISMSSDIPPEKIAMDRFHAVQSFSKEAYLKQLREKAHIYRMEGKHGLFKERKRNKKSKKY